MKRIFGKRDKSSANLSVPKDSQGGFTSTFSNKSSEYVLPDLNTPPDCNGSEASQRPTSPLRQSATYANPSAANSKISFTMPGFKRKQTIASQGAATPRASIASSGSSELEFPPSRTSVFAAFGKSSSSYSLPTPKAHDNPPRLPPISLGEPPVLSRPPAMTAQTLPIPKTPEMRASNTVKIFNWGSKPTRTSDVPKLDLQIPSSSTQDTLDSFSLKSFRPVRPLSPQPPPGGALDLELNSFAPPPALEQPLSESPSTFAPPSTIGNNNRPRSRTGSDASQKITVAQFRQAQLESAKNRSSVHLPVPEHPSDSMPPGNVPLHVSLARPNSPGFAIANSFVNTETGGGGNAYENESAVGGSTPNGTPSRPARLLPPQAMGRSSPIPRNGSPIASSSSPRLRPQQPTEGSRLSAKWMISSSSDSDNSDDTASEDFSRRKAGRPAKKPPLIGDLRMNGGANSPQRQPAAASRNSGPYPSSFASSSSLKATISASKSDLGHSSSSTAHPHPVVSAPPSQQAPQSRNGSFALSSSPSQNIKPGQYSGGRERSPSVLTNQTSQSADVWSNTHSQVHSRQNSRDQFQAPKGIAKSDLGHGSPITRPNPLQRTNKYDGPGSSSSLSKATGVSRSLSTNVLGSTASSFTRANLRTVAPAESEADDEEQPSTEEEEDDAPLSSLVPPRRIGSGYSQGSGSPSGSARNLLLSDQSPSTSPRPDNNLASPNVRTVSPNFSRPSGTGNSRQGSTHSTTSGTVTSDPKSRGRKPLLDFSSESPKSSKGIPSPVMSSPKATTPNGGQAALLTPPISEKESNGTRKPRPDAKNATSKSTVGSAGREMTSAGSPAFLRAGSAPINRSHDLLSRPLIRDDSPVSSIGNSSVGSGRYPQTPRSGSEAGLNVAVGSHSMITTSSGSSARNSHSKRSSVTFDDVVSFAPEKYSDRDGVSERSAGYNRDGTLDEEAKRNERRRGEAKNAVELGRVVNGPPPVDWDDETHEHLSARSHSPTHQWNALQQMQMQQMQAMAMGMPPATPAMPSFNMGSPAFNPMMSMNMGNMSNMTPSPQMFNPMMPNGFGMPPGFSLPPVPQMPNMMMGMDPAVMAAHQQAMLMAKHAYQMAVAQQAIAAAGEEWERSSNVGGYSGTGSRPPTLFGAHSGSMYGGGSLLGMPSMGSGSVWGGSVYGEPFGPSMQRGSAGNNHAFPSSAFPSSATEFGENIRGPRKRTMTAPSSALPPAHLRGAGAPPLPPPSSWRPS